MCQFKKIKFELSIEMVEQFKKIFTIRVKKNNLNSELYFFICK